MSRFVTHGHCECFKLSKISQEKRVYAVAPLLHCGTPVAVPIEWILQVGTARTFFEKGDQRQVIKQSFRFMKKCMKNNCTIQG